MKIGMIGGRTSISGFQVLGLETFPVAEPGQAVEVWREIELERFGLMFLTEPVYRVLAGELEARGANELPVVAVIPAVSGSEGIGRSEIRDLVERATGTSMIIGE